MERELHEEIPEGEVLDSAAELVAVLAHFLRNIKCILGKKKNKSHARSGHDA